VVELAVEQRDVDMTEPIADAGDNLDVAIMLAYAEGADLLDLKVATKLPVEYLVRLTNGSL
jgi:hypothetical protein